MRLTLINLDNGLFLEKVGRWTSEPRFAQEFQNASEIARAALENKVKNAVVAMIDGDPPQARGFLWGISN
jgi:hypothetical protein